MKFLKNIKNFNVFIFSDFYNNEPDIGMMVRVFANSLGDLGSIPGRVMPKTLKIWYLMPPCLTLSIIKYVSRVKWCNPGKGVALSPTPWCSSYWKGSFRVTLDYGRQLYFTYNNEVLSGIMKKKCKKKPKLFIILLLLSVCLHVMLTHIYIFLYLPAAKWDLLPTLPFNQFGYSCLCLI